MDGVTESHLIIKKLLLLFLFFLFFMVFYYSLSSKLACSDTFSAQKLLQILIHFQTHHQLSVY